MRVDRDLIAHSRRVRIASGERVVTVHDNRHLHGNKKSLGAHDAAALADDPEHQPVEFLRTFEIVLVRLELLAVDDGGGSDREGEPEAIRLGLLSLPR